VGNSVLDLSLGAQNQCQNEDITKGVLLRHSIAVAHFDIELDFSACEPSVLRASKFA
jgi:hypothetical protein